MSQRDFIPVGIAVMTVSDTRTEADDKSGQTLADRIEAAGHRLIHRAIVRDDAEAIRQTVRDWTADPEVDAILTTGGTGVALRDVTPEAVREIAVRELPGFGEVMRAESMKITKNAILSRNLAAVVGKSLVLCLPGKPSGAVECLGFVVGAIPEETWSKRLMGFGAGLAYWAFLSILLYGLIAGVPPQ